MNYRNVFLASLAMISASIFAVPAQAQGLADIGRFLLGLPAEEKEPIEYRERAPLVVPPSQNLRPPTESVPAENRRANWPQDADVVARRKAAEDARKPRMVDSITGRDEAPVRRMTTDEIRAGRIAGQEVVTTPQHTTHDIVRDRSNIFGGLAAIRELDRRDAEGKGPDGALARAEPPREFLTDPPTGTRRPSDRAAFKATREGSLGVRADPSPFDIFKEGPSTR